MRVVYQWTEDGVPEVGNLEQIVTEKEMECYHCGCKIPADTPVAKVHSEDGDVYLMHWECAKKGCTTSIEQAVL